MTTIGVVTPASNHTSSTITHVGRGSEEGAVGKPLVAHEPRYLVALPAAMAASMASISST